MSRHSAPGGGVCRRTDREPIRNDAGEIIGYRCNGCGAAHAAAAIVRSGADLSPCGTFRFRLWRRWGADGAPAAGFVMLNPSTADALSDDATIRRCNAFARAWGCGGIEVVNLFAFRATDPAELLRFLAAGGPAAGGPLADAAILELPERTRGGPIVCAWGCAPTEVQGAWTRRAEVLQLLRQAGAELHRLRLTKGGEPAHPLRLPATLAPVRWVP